MFQFNVVFILQTPAIKNTKVRSVDLIQQNNPKSWMRQKHGKYLFCQAILRKYVVDNQINQERTEKVVRGRAKLKGGGGCEH